MFALLFSLLRNKFGLWFFNVVVMFVCWTKILSDSSGETFTVSQTLVTQSICRRFNFAILRINRNDYFFLFTARYTLAIFLLKFFTDTPSNNEWTWTAPERKCKKIHANLNADILFFFALADTHRTFGIFKFRLYFFFSALVDSIFLCAQTLAEKETHRN